MEGVTRLDLDYPTKSFPELREERIQSFMEERQAGGGEKGEEKAETVEEGDEEGECR